MQPRRIVPIHFSGTRTTKKIIDALAAEISASASMPIQEYDLRETNPPAEVTLAPDDLAIVGMPVYSGRIPEIGRHRLEMFKGTGTPAIAVVVYGNRAYDDALVELVDVLTADGFNVFAGGAFLAEHCIFPNVAAGRPDDADMAKVAGFAREAAGKLGSVGVGSGPVQVKGNRPYVQPAKGSGLQPTLKEEDCIYCGACSLVCPNGALFVEPDGKSMRKNPERCVTCCACIKVCPTGAQKFRGEQYETVRKMFEEKFAARLEPEVFL